MPEAPEGAQVILGFRPEHVHRATSAPLADGHVRLGSKIELIQPTGSRSYATFKLGGQQAIAELRAHDANRVGEAIEIDVDLTRAVLFDAATGKALRGSRR
jgi:multiple sugar transport system ATP-binding protein